MRRKNTLTLIIAFIGMLILILDSKTAIQGAKTGIEVCMESLVPTLFPFFYLSAIITEKLSESTSSAQTTFSKILKIPQGSESLFLIGCLGGYPVGAKCVSQAYDNGTLSRENASRMLIFCNNCGPAFIFGIFSHFFEGALIPWLIWLTQIISAIFMARILPAKTENPLHRSNVHNTNTSKLKLSIYSMVLVCGWVVLFRVLLTFMERWCGFLLNPIIKPLFFGFIELANGSLQLKNITDTGQRFVICNAIASLGGICVTMQTMGIVNNQLNLRIYFPGKILQCTVAVILSCIINALVLHGTVPISIIAICSVILVFTVIFFRKREKSSSNLQLAGV